MKRLNLALWQGLKAAAAVSIIMTCLGIFLYRYSSNRDSLPLPESYAGKSILLVFIILVTTTTLALIGGKDEA